MKQDFVGFSFDGVHSSELNILRVSDSDRYTEDLFPQINDLTLDIPMQDGTPFYGTHFQQREIPINIAFDSVTEEQYRNIRRLFGKKAICPLIFDERPYKVYMAKVSEPIQLETICFDERDYNWVEHSAEDGYIPGSINHKEFLDTRRRIYKGEGSINFICYYPFAHQQFKILESYADYENVNEWAASSGILTKELYEKGSYDKYLEKTAQRFGDIFNGQFNVYNPGDIPAPYYLFIPFTEGKINPKEGDIYIRISSDGVDDLYLKPIERRESPIIEENGIIISTRAELIEGVRFDKITKTWQKSGNLYNDCIQSGKFGKIQNGDQFSYRTQTIYLSYDNSGDEKPEIFYNYLYY